MARTLPGGCLELQGHRQRCDIAPQRARHDLRDPTQHGSRRVQGSLRYADLRVGRIEGGFHSEVREDLNGELHQ